MEIFQEAYYTRTRNHDIMIAVSRNMIGSAIQKKRKELGLTQSQLAALLGVTAPAVNRWEKDLSFPYTALLAPLARCLKSDLNGLFSFYDSLSDKKRQLIIEKVRKSVLLDKRDDALAYIDDVIQANLSGGKLCLEIANTLLGAHTLKKAIDPMIYLKQIANLYERATKLLPEQADEISHTLITVYTELGKADKAEEARSRLPGKCFDKAWSHAEMLFKLKDYGGVLPEIRKLVLVEIINLSERLVFLGNALYLSSDRIAAELAEKYDRELRELFGLWRGIDTINLVSGAIETRPEDACEVKLSELFSDDFSQDQLSTFPLFDGAVVGGVSNGKASTADYIADLLSALKKLPNRQCQTSEV